jgi:nucleoside-diphosphate-sugar epimerase
MQGQHPNLTIVEGDLTKPETLVDFLLPGCTVINLAYGFDLTSAENVRAAENLIEICKKINVKRLIHCSTASVFGSNHEDFVSEESPCEPQTEYGVAKLLIEQILQDGASGCVEFTNLRPTSVFGERGPALTKLIGSLKNDSILLNYLKSCLFNKRRLNLVSVDTVVAAILFVVNQKQNVAGQTFIISEDDEAINNFEYVEKYIFKKLYGKYYPVPPIRVSLWVLSLILKVLRREPHSPNKIYSSNKLRKLGFVVPRPLALSLEDFVQWKLRQDNNP